jgi:hypothetical protein
LGYELIILFNYFLLSTTSLGTCVMQFCLEFYALILFSKYRNTRYELYPLKLPVNYDYGSSGVFLVSCLNQIENCWQGRALLRPAGTVKDPDLSAVALSTVGCGRNWSQHLLKNPLFLFKLFCFLQFIFSFIEAFLLSLTALFSMIIDHSQYEIICSKSNKTITLR